MTRKREAEILQAGVDVFAEKGYAAATIHDIADRVGVLKGSLYYYIESKEDLLFRIGCATNAEAAAILHEVQSLDLPPLERLQLYLTRYLEWYLTHFQVVSLYLSEWVHLTGERRAVGVKLRHEFEDFLRGGTHGAGRPSMRWPGPTPGWRSLSPSDIPPSRASVYDDRAPPPRFLRGHLGRRPPQVIRS